MIELKTSN